MEKTIFVILISWVVLSFGQNYNQLIIGPIVSDYPTKWDIPFYCSSGFIYGGRVSSDNYDEGGIYLEPYCHDLLSPGQDKPEQCPGYVVGYNAEWVPAVGVSLLELICNDGQAIMLMDHRTTCIQDSLPQDPQECPIGYGICGFERTITVLDNMRFTCCKLNKSETDATPPRTIIIGNGTFPVIGPVNPQVPFQPNISVHNSKLAYGLDIENYTRADYFLPTQVFNMKFGRKQELNMQNCPWYLNGIQVEILHDVLRQMWIHCYDGSLREVYKNYEVIGNGVKVLRFRCPVWTVVCGFIMDKIFLANLQLICCPLNKDNMLDKQPNPVVAYEQIHQNIYKIGLTLRREDTKFMIKDFNLKTHPIIRTLLNNIKTTLTKLGHDPNLININFNQTIQLRHTIFSNNVFNTFQLTVRYESYVFLLNSLKEVIRTCPEAESSQVLDTACTVRDYKSRECKYYWNLYALNTEHGLYNRRHEELHLVQFKNRMANAYIPLGLVERPIPLEYARLNLFEDWKLAMPGYIESIERYLAPYDFGTILTFDFTKRWTEHTVYFKPNSTYFYTYFQVVAECGPFVFHFDEYDELEFNSTWGKSYDDLIVNCRVPLAEGVRHDRVLYHCRREKDGKDVDLSLPPTTLPPPTTTPTTTLSTSTEPSTEVPTTVVPPLAERPDIMILLDGSAEVTDANFTDAKLFLANMIKSCPSKNYALIEFSNRTQLLDLHSKLTPEEKEKRLKGLKKSNGGARHSHLAIFLGKALLNYFEIKRGITQILYIAFGAPSNYEATLNQGIASKIAGIVFWTIELRGEEKIEESSSEEIDPPMPLFLASKASDEFVFNFTYQLLGSLGRIACKLCGTNGAKTEGMPILFLLDGAQSDFDESFNATKKLFVEFVKLCPSNKFGLVEFSKTANNAIELKQWEASELEKKIWAVQKSNDTRRDAFVAIKEARSVLPIGPGPVVIYTTFGAGRKMGDAIPEAKELRESGTRIFGLVLEEEEGIEEMKQLTGVPQNTFNYASPLDVKTAAKELDCQVCRAEPPIVG